MCSSSSEILSVLKRHNGELEGERTQTKEREIEKRERTEKEYL